MLNTKITKARISRPRIWRRRSVWRGSVGFWCAMVVAGVFSGAFLMIDDEVQSRFRSCSNGRWDVILER
jgi:hypothetical protein